MDDPKFRSLLADYTAELQDPKARLEHEAYLREVEERAANDPAAQASGDYSAVPGAMHIPKGSKLVSPTPVFCVKMIVEANAARKNDTKAKSTQQQPTTAPAAATKIFVNMCTCDALNDASSEKVAASGSDKAKAQTVSQMAGVQVSLPYSLSDARALVDASGAPAKVYDFTFSSATWEQYKSHLRFVAMFEEMAVEAVEDREGLQRGAIDKAKTIILKNTTFKGGKPPPRLFKVAEEKWKQQQKEREEQEGKTQTPSAAPQQKKAAATSTAATGAAADLKQVSSKKSAPAAAAAATAPAKDPRATPSFQLVHRGFYDLTRGQMLLPNEAPSDVLSELAASRPAELVLKVSLPLLENGVGDLNLDQAARQLLLSSHNYFLLMPLPFPVRTEAGKAAWSAKTKTLTVTMVVAPPDQDEIAKFREQRKGFEQMQKDKLEASSKEQRAEKQEEEDRIARKKEEEKEAAAEEHARRQAEIDATAAAIATAAAAASSSSSAAALPLSSSLKSPALTSSSAAPLLSSSASSPSIVPVSGGGGSGSPKRVRFSLCEQAGFVVPERDGPTGPKPVGLLHPPVSEAADHKPPPKGHKKKHVPGTEGPEAWTGIGREPTSKTIRDAFPPEHVDASLALSPTSVPASPKAGPTASPKLSGAAGVAGAAATQRLWPAYTYNQSAVSVVLVIKIKSIAADSVKLLMEDGPAGSAAGTGSGETTRVDLYFSTTSPKKHYRLFLPLSHAINIAKSNFTATPQNLVINLVKKPAVVAAAHSTVAVATSGGGGANPSAPPPHPHHSAAPAPATTATGGAVKSNEWEHLLDYSVLGDFDREGTPLSSPAPSPRPTTSAGPAPAAAAALEELSLGTTAHAHQASLDASSAALVQEVEEENAASINTLELERSSLSENSKPTVALQLLPLTASSMLNPFVTTSSSAPTTSVANTTAAPTFAAANSLLFQLD